MTDRKIDDAELDWGAGAPRSVFFDDIYFSGDGPAETAHVFIDGNNLRQRFATAERFVIGELGFGSGLNFLVAWDLWRRLRVSPNARLHFLSFEKYPFSMADLERAHAAWPQFSELSARLRDALPPPQPGFHQFDLDESASLTLYYGDVREGLTQTNARADAWFLDGFSPAKNPEMWAREVMDEAARLSAPDATFATFTVAGAVRRTLEAAGFATEKRTGYGRKREMLSGRLTTAPTVKEPAPWFATHGKTVLAPGARIAVVGAGIAGASLAAALRAQGFLPTAYDANGPAAGASGNAAGLIMPRLDVGDTPAAAFFTQSYLTAIATYARLDAEAFNRCGVLHHATTRADRERFEKLLAAQALPHGWIEAHQDGLFFPQGGVADPRMLVAALLGETEIRNTAVRRLKLDDGRWRVESADGEDRFDAVIVANALDALKFSQSRGLPLAGSAGQIDLFPGAAAPDVAHAFGPYAAPAPGGGLVIGATYAPVAIGAAPRFSPEATQSNLEAVRRVLPDLVADLDPSAAIPRVAIRCTTPDRLPIVGPAPDWGYYSGAYDDLRVGARRAYPAGETYHGLFFLTGLGSRGLVTAPLCAAAIAAALADAPAPFARSFADALHPARFFIRDLKRGREPVGGVVAR
ncbi:MAG: bifunctional tRNA (5-methylaminomethyl-2-thiouridine)(34)-methyltransferase MnmD/FAD-dependent 5-carboxymethylaminomethyl-2-thiouridine(34) oxidoreductase MnmC [Pseudomonadota bacterium]